MPTPPEPWRILSASDAIPRLRAARGHLDEALRALGPLPETQREVPRDEFIVASSWHSRMQDVLDLVAVTGEPAIGREDLAVTSERMSLMRAVLALVEPFDEAAAQLRDACVELQEEVYGPLYDAEDRLRALSNDDPPLAERLREIGVLVDVEDDRVERSGSSDG
jgi:hypothetical protein